MEYPRTTVRRTARRVLLALFAACLWQVDAHAGTTVQDIHKRGALRCGVSEAVPGLAAQDGKGQWQGLETDFCRAVAAAVLGDAERVKFVPPRASQRFPALLTNRVDLPPGPAGLAASRRPAPRRIRTTWATPRSASRRTPPTTSACGIWERTRVSRCNP